jgi:hypothetical protein
MHQFGSFGKRISPWHLLRDFWCNGNYLSTGGRRCRQIPDGSNHKDEHDWNHEPLGSGHQRDRPTSDDYFRSKPFWHSQPRLNNYRQPWHLARLASAFL